MVSRKGLEKRPKWSEAVLAEGTASAKALKQAVLSVDKKSWGQTVWSRVSQGRGAEGELRDAKEAHICLRNLGLFQM